LQGVFIEGVACSPGYLGCAISHLKTLIWEKKNNKIPCLVLENDCDVTINFQSKINAPDDSDII
jgi:GR25 family glycosyltransferase involved in LPS biosynthesis